MVHTLTFSNISANFVKDKELLGNQDPYIVFELGSTRTQTKALKNAGTHAVWKDSYTMEANTTSGATELVAAAYNHNTLLPDGLLGSGKVNLSSLEEGSFTGSPTSIPLFDKKGARIGELSLTINGGGYKGRGMTGSGVGTGTTTGAATGAATGVTGAGTALGATGAGTHHHGTRDARTAEENLTKDNYASETSGVRGIGGAHGVNTTGSNVTGGTQGVNTTGSNVTGGTRGINTAEQGSRDASGNIIDRKYYTTVEDRPVDQELVEKVREHNPYEQQYKTTVQHTGRERQVGADIQALGTQERVIGTENVIQGHPHHVIERNLPAGTLNERPGGEGWVQNKPGPICDEKTFAVGGDRLVDKERVTALKEHRDFEKEFEIKTQLEGERQLGTQPELLDRERNVVGVKKTTPCEGHPNIS